MEIKERLIFAKKYIDAAIGDIEKAPEKNDIAELLHLVGGMNEFYKEWCTEHDETVGDPEGTTYKHGVSLEFYMEADDMHDLSLAFRKLVLNDGEDN